MSVECPELRQLSSKPSAEDAFPFVIRIRGTLQKRSGSFPYSWNQRHMIVAGNFLLEFVNTSESSPRKVVLLDGCTITRLDDKAQPFAMLVTTTAMRKLQLAADSAESREAWIRQMSNAGYDKMAARAVNAQRFIAKCAELMAKDVAAEAEAGQPAAAGAGAGGDAPADGAAAAAAPAGEGAAEPAAGSEAQAGEPAAASAPGHAAPGASSATSIASSVGRGPTAQDALNAVFEWMEERRRLYEELAEARNRSSTLPEDRSALEATVAASQGAFVRELRQRVAELEDTCADASREAAELRTANARLEAQVRELTVRAETAEAASAEATERAEGEEDSIAALQAALASSRAEAAALRRTNESLEAARVESDAAAAAAGPPASAPAGDDGSTTTTTAGGPTAASTTASGAAAAGAAGRGDGSGRAGNGMSARVSAAGEDARRYEWEPYYKDAQAHEGAGNLAGAQELFQQVYDIRKRISGPRSVAVATAARNLGRVLALQRQFREAKERYSEAVEVSTEVLGPTHANTACALTDLAAVLREQGHFAQAEERARQAVEALKASVGARDVSTATAMYNLAGLQKRSHKYDDARATYEEALEIFRERLGEGKGETADTLYQLGSLFRRSKAYSEAMDRFNQAATAYAQAYGRDDRRVSEATRRATAMIEAMSRPR
ncbi:hypothetical protein FNF27_00836 [Cafeteria roenbergensis]|uniref:PH domain-containing protein n=1 Tax=Cafeteria roenbergensis TaxID=33653 RepID=A0A5A8EI62_CAFRO|nr:hypothetical protein FNF27_00836 [Cafeteria roenbergensis]